MNTSRERWLGIIDGLPHLLRMAPDRLTGKTKIVITLELDDDDQNFKMVLASDPPGASPVPSIPEQTGSFINVLTANPERLQELADEVKKHGGPTSAVIEHVGPEDATIIMQPRGGLLMEQMGGRTLRPGEMRTYDLREHVPSGTLKLGPDGNLLTPTPANSEKRNIVVPIDLSRAEDTLANMLGQPGFPAIQQKRVWVHLNNRKGRYGSFDGDTRAAAFQQAWDKNEDEIADIMEGDLDEAAAVVLKNDGPEAVVRWWWLGANGEQAEFGQSIEVEE